MITEKEFIQKWKHTDFTNHNETDIREDFIRPLLYLLGYSKNTIKDIITEKTLELSKNFQRVGRKQIRIDYVPTIRLKAFWILEAKSGVPKEMDAGDMLQAYLYATHPEIQASYVVICNGWVLKVYDVHNYSNWAEPVFTIDHRNCEEKFEELRETLGAESILKFQRDNLLRKIHDTFEVEIEEKQLDDFCREFEKNKRELRSVIKENARQLWRTEFEKRDNAETEQIRGLDDKGLIRHMGLYSGGYKAEKEYLKRIEESDPERRTELLLQLSRTYFGRAKATFKCHYLRILIHVYEAGLEIAPSKFWLGIEESIKDVIEKNLNYWEESDLENALCFLDRTCCRAAGVLVKDFVMDYGSKLAEDKKKYLPKEDRLTQNISTAHEIVPCIFCVAEALWYIFSYANSSTEIRKHVILMNNMIDSIVERVGIREYPDNEEDLFHFEHYGDNFDYLSSVTCLIIEKNCDALRRIDVGKDIIGKAFSQDYGSVIPKFNDAEVGDISDSEKEAFRIKVIHALMMGMQLYSETTQEVL